ncbi:MAG: GAF domain-containing protein [Anaerolineae bacterium]|nr:GAF domain-containing protein [Anaerolineae bacterium]
MGPTYRDFLSEDPSPPGVLRFGGARMALLDIEAGFWGMRRQLEALVGPRLTDAALQQAGANGGASFARAFAPDVSPQMAAQALHECVVAYQAAGFGRFQIEVLEWPVGRIVIRAWDTFEAWMTQQHGQQPEQPMCAYSAGVLVGFVNALAGRHDVVCIEHTCQAQGADSCLFELLPAKAAGDTPVITFAPDPGLGQQLNMLEILFDRMPMGIAVFDREYHIRRYNPTWKDFAERYAPPSATPLAPGVYYFDLLPGSEPTVIPLFERVLTGETIRQKAVRLESGGVVTYWDVVLAPLIEDGEVAGILNVTVDATERVESRRNLEQRVEERTRELQTLLDVTAAASSSLELDEMLNAALDRLVALVGASRVGVMLLDSDSGELEPRMLRPEQPIAADDLAEMTPACHAVIAGGEPLYVPPDPEKGFLEPGALLPLRVRGQALGILVIIGPQGSMFSEGHLALFESIADQLGVAVENARLYEQAEQAAVVAERSRLARDLHDAVTQTLFSASLIAEVLPRIWERHPDEGLRRLGELRELTRGALAEMRTLLLELRPSALVDAALSDLLRQLAESITGRARVPVSVEVEDECPLPPEVKVALYRIAQEALNNVAKHAGAGQAAVSLHYIPPACGGDRGGAVELRVSDDGRGFDPQSVPPESLGLGIMRERAEAIGAALNVDSEVGHGTQVVVVWKDTGGGKQP